MKRRANVRVSASRVLVACGALVACAPPVSRGAVAPPAPMPSVSASAAAPPPALTPAPVTAPFCVPNNRLLTWLDDAWPDGDRVVVCVGPPPGTPPEAEAAPPSCLSVGKAGDYRAEARRTGPAKPPVPSVPFRRVSVDGLLAFDVDGGRRSPHRAVGTLRDARTHRVLKRAPVEYDEHLEFLGWVGRGVVLRTRVDEGPGCRLRLVDPTKDWPIGAEAGTDVGDCFHDDASMDQGVFDGHLVLRPSDGVFAIVSAGGENVAFVDEATLAITFVKTRSGGGPEAGTRFVAWMEGDSILVIAYGAPSAGDVARIDLKRRTLDAAWSAPVCER
jgi:hypothetical protein